MNALTLFVVLAIICVIFCMLRPEEFEGKPINLDREPSQCYQDSEESEDDFPEPDLSYPGMVPDPHTCLSKVAEYEDLAERARACGRDDLASRYEDAAAHWRYLYEEAEDEEMEW